MRVATFMDFSPYGANGTTILTGVQDNPLYLALGL
jgi:hypothetical protein